MPSYELITIKAEYAVPVIALSDGMRCRYIKLRSVALQRALFVTTFVEIVVSCGD
jgi:hypothetical protein